VADRFSEVVVALALISATILFALSLTLVAARLRRDRRELRQRAARAAVTTALQERGEPLQAVIAAAVRPPLTPSGSASPRSGARVLVSVMGRV